LAQVRIDAVQVEPARVEYATDPHHVLLILIMVRVRQCLEEIGIPVAAADIFQRARIPSGQTQWHGRKLCAASTLSRLEEQPVLSYCLT
jgi:hypothetical protein